MMNQSRNLDSLSKKSFFQKLTYFLFFFQFVFISAFAQVTIKGNVQNAKGELLQGVTVALKGSQIASGTNSKGEYSIDIPNENGTLVFSYVGYASQEIPVSGKRTINVILQESAASLQGVVVIGYGTQSNTTTTTAITKL